MTCITFHQLAPTAVILSLNLISTEKHSPPNSKRSLTEHQIVEMYLRLRAGPNQAKTILLVPSPPKLLKLSHLLNPQNGYRNDR